MASMLRDVRGGEGGVPSVNVDALKSEIRRALINQKANACPIAMRLAWHAAGTFDRSDNTGGCNGGTIRFPHEASDPDNKGLLIIRDLLHPVKVAHPEISHADLFAAAGCAAIEFLGGPSVPFNFGRSDDPDESKAVPHGRLPDAAQGADHLRAVFGERMGFSDQEIVALSGAHTLGRCHEVRSGFDGPWTSQPLKFDNEYFVNLVTKEWRPRTWHGKFQFEDVETGKLMMLPTDMALVQDPRFRPYVELYAKSQDAWFRDFARAYGKLLALGCPAAAQPSHKPEAPTAKQLASAEFREHAMHGSVVHAKKVEASADVHSVEDTSDRTALHKAAFWGHYQMVSYLVDSCRLDVNARDRTGDTALHDAARFGHKSVVDILVRAGTDLSIRNAAGHTALAVAEEHGHADVVAVLRAAQPRSRL